MRSLVFVLATLATSSLVSADEQKDKSGSLVFVREGGVFHVDAYDPSATPRELRKVPAEWVPDAIAVGGPWALVRQGESHWLVDLRSDAPPITTACKAAAVLSRDGKQLLCRGDGDTALHYRPGASASPTSLPFGKGPYAFAPDGAAIVARPTGVWRTQPRARAARKRLAPHVIVGEMAVGHKAQRAVAMLEGAIYTFRLDGVGVRRKMFLEGRPLRFSGDSGFVIVAQEKAGCTVRATGGQYKCWDGYQPVAINANASYVFLTRDDDDGKPNLFVASTEGARPVAPRQLLVRVRAAAWVPRPAPGPTATPP